MIYTWDIDPVLVDFGIVQIRYYGVLFASGLLLASSTAGWFFRKQGLDEDELNTAVLLMIAGLIVGAHWVHLIFYEPHSIFNNPRRIIEFGSGLASHGGGLGVIGALYWYTRRKGISFFTFADPIAAGAMWIVPTVRLGNFFNSEIYGRATEGSWGVIFARRGLTEPRHPSQLYEAAIGLAIVLFAMWFYKKYARRLRQGAMVYLVLFLYFVSRFFIEYVKEYQILSDALPLTMGQLLSTPIFLFCLYQLAFNQKRKLWPLLGEDVAEERRLEEKERIEALQQKYEKARQKASKQKGKKKK